jgi:hypothetical protein
MRDTRWITSTNGRGTLRKVSVFQREFQNPEVITEANKKLDLNNTAHDIKKTENHQRTHEKELIYFLTLQKNINFKIRNSPFHFIIFIIW